ncbi:MAG: amidohydrolase family protein [Actinobacteria bacterium]|nr:amidohydrolase family protein [Actinomycetota bacterium]MSX10273.1 amidohydrolase family protein [Actinomycetota bacterium]MSX67479.1 amidohydrolase family protein [Actinomycetota bacterium]
MPELPMIISVDDHVVEPANLWIDRLPSKYHDVGPRIKRAPMGEVTFIGGKLTIKPGSEGAPADWWRYEDLRRPLLRVDSAVGVPRDQVTMSGITFDDMRPGSFEQKSRLEDMDVNHIEASLCFPTFPRFCGQTFTEAKDKELALLCVQAYNDWMVDEWCAGTSGRLIPLIIVPLWDANLAADEVRRNAARGVRAVCFSEIPAYLGLPSIHDPDNYWDPFFAACDETSMIVNMHIGSSSKMPSTSADAPAAVGSSLTHINAELSMTDFLFSGLFERFSNLKVAYSEGQIGWIPYLLHRMDVVWEDNRGWGGVADKVPNPPSTYFPDHVFGCFFDDPNGLKLIDEIGADNITYESDYPHSDSTWPNTAQLALEQMAGLSDEQIWKVVRGNAIKLFGLDLTS